MSAGIKTQLDSSYAEKVKQAFSSLMNDLNKNGNIDIKINTTDVKDQLNGTVKSINDAIQKLSALGNVSIPKIFKDENGNISGFIANLERAKGVIEELKFSATNNKVADANDIMAPLDYKLDNSTILNKQNEYAQKIAEAQVQEKEQNNNLIEQENTKLKVIQMQYEQKLKSIQATANELQNEELLNKLNNFQNKLDNTASTGAIGQQELKNDYQDIVTLEDQLVNAKKEEQKITADNINQQLKEQEAVKATADKEAQRIQGLGQLKTKIDPNLFSKSNQDIEKYIQSIYGSQAKITNFKKSLDDANSSAIKMTVTTKTGKDTIEQENIVLDKNTNAMYKSSESIKQNSTNMNSFISRIKNAATAVLSFATVTTALYSTLHEIQNAVSFVTNIDTKLSDIAMITGESKDSLKEYASAWNDLAINMKVGTNDVIDSNEAFMRAGKSIDESNKLVETNIKFSRVSDEETGKMAEDLVKLSNAYNLSAEGVDKYANKVAYLDSATAASSKGINAATIYAAQTAQATGMSLDYLIAMVTTVEESSKKGAEAIGRSFKSILLNMEKIQQTDLKAPLSTLEKTLNSQGIALRANEHEWRNSEDVIKDIQKAWGNMDGVTRSTITQYIAGKNQAEEFTAIMSKASRVQENYNGALSATNNLNDKYKEHLDSVQGNMNELKATTEKLYMSMINSNAINTVVKGLTSLVGVLQTVINSTTGTKIAILSMIPVIILLAVNIKAVIMDIATAPTQIGLLDTVLKLFLGTAVSGAGIVAGLSSAFTTLKGVMATLFFTPQGLAILGVAAAIGLATTAIIKHINHQKQLKQTTDELTTSTKNLTQAMKDNDIETMKTEYNKLKAQQDKLNDLMAQKAKLEAQISKATNDGGSNFDMKGVKYDGSLSKLTSDLTNVDQQIKDLTGSMDKAGVSEQQLATASQIINLDEKANEIKKLAETRKQEDNDTISLISRYQELNAIQDRNEAQQKEMSNIAAILASKNKDLKVTVDEHGNAVITNTDLLGKQKDALNLDIQTTDADTQAKLNNAINSMKFEYDNTTYTIEQVQKRIAAYSAEIEAMSTLAQARNDSTGGYTYVDTKTQQMLAFYMDAQSEVDKIKGSVSTTNAPGTTGISGDSSYFPSEGGDSSKSKSSKSTTGWIQNPHTGKWYFYKDNKMCTGWVEVDSKWYYLGSDGVMQTGWIKDGDTWYYLGASGDMYADKWAGDYHLSKSGAMDTSTMTSDDYFVDSTGKWNGGASLKQVQKTIDDYETKTSNTMANLDYEEKLLPSDNVLGKVDLAKQKLSALNDQMKNNITQLNYLKTITVTNADAQDTLNKAIADTESKIISEKSSVADLTSSLKQLYQQQAETLAEQAIYGGQTQKQYEYDAQVKMNAIQRQIDALQQENDLQAEQEQRIQNQNDLTEKNIALQKAKSQLTVQELTKNADGTWQYTYVADASAVESAQKAYNDQLESNNKWELDTAKKHQIDMLNQEKQAIQDEMDYRQSAFEQVKNQLTDFFGDGENKNGTIGDVIVGGIDKATQLAGERMDNLADTIKQKISDLSVQFDQLGSIGSGTTPSKTGSSILSTVGNVIGTVVGDIGHIFGFKEGGEVNYTGLAQVHGTPSNPEFMLSNSMLNNVASFVTDPAKYLNIKIPTLPDISKINNNNNNNNNIGSGLKQDIVIQANFPNVTAKEEIRQALISLPTQASQSAYNI